MIPSSGYLFVNMLSALRIMLGLRDERFLSVHAFLQDCTPSRGSAWANLSGAGEEDGGWIDRLASCSLSGWGTDACLSD
jgi:hypothetical protein